MGRWLPLFMAVYFPAAPFYYIHCVEGGKVFEEEVFSYGFHDREGPVFYISFTFL